MNTVKHRITLLPLLMCLVLMTMSCTRIEPWEPGPLPAADNPGVFFDQSNPKLIEMGANAQGELSQNYFTITVGRDPFKASSALSVPVQVHYADPNLTVARTIEFPAGEIFTELEVSVGQYEFGVQYNVSMEIDEKYSNPYKVFAENESKGSSRIDLKMEVVCLAGIGTFTATDFSGSTPPQFYPFEHKIYDNQDGTYTIKNFLFNNAGYDFRFSIDADNNFRPAEDCGYHSLGDDRWYFYAANSDASANRIPCYIPGANPNDNVTYIYFYTAENTSKYTDFWLDLEGKRGRMMGYSRYSVSSSGRIAFNIVLK
ncbi:MAG: hypothetical protein GX877_05025 [Bacteroidales bacterium]|nr:hypothetical protein [Bacteroidales bacterium]